MPIYPPAMVHQQLLQDTKSRINACPDTGLDTNPYRWGSACGSHVRQLPCAPPPALQAVGLARCGNVCSCASSWTLHVPSSGIACSSPIWVSMQGAGCSQPGCTQTD